MAPVAFFVAHDKAAMGRVGRRVPRQGRSGRCWIFTSLASLRLGGEFSASFFCFWDLFEKSRAFLERVRVELSSPGVSDCTPYDAPLRKCIRAPLHDGGMWANFVHLACKYGAVPFDSFKDSEGARDTRKVLGVLRKVLRIFAGEMYELRGTAGPDFARKVGAQIRERMLPAVRSILVAHMGEPPQLVHAGAASFTPREWAEAHLPLAEMRRFTALRCTALFPEGVTLTTAAMCNSAREESFINTGMRTMKRAALHMLSQGRGVYASFNSRDQVDKKRAVGSTTEVAPSTARYGVECGLAPRTREVFSVNSSDHAMAIVDVVAGGDPGLPLWERPVSKWILENSQDHSPEGRLVVDDAWFEMYTFLVVASPGACAAAGVVASGKRANMDGRPCCGNVMYWK